MTPERLAAIRALVDRDPELIVSYYDPLSLALIDADGTEWSRFPLIDLMRELLDEIDRLRAGDTEARDVWIVDVPGDDRFETYRTEQAAVYRAEELCEAAVPVVLVRRYRASPNPIK